MKKVWTLLLTLTISTLFIHVPHKGEIGFLFHPTTIDPCTGNIVELKLSYNQYFWFIGESIIKLTYVAILVDETRDYKWILKWFLGITIADVVLWPMAYYDPLKDYIFTWNILKTLVFLAVIGYYQWHQKRRI